MQPNQYLSVRFGLSKIFFGYQAGRAFVTWARGLPRRHPAPCHAIGAPGGAGAGPVPWHRHGWRHWPRVARVGAPCHGIGADTDRGASMAHGGGVDVARGAPGGVALPNGIDARLARSRGIGFTLNLLKK